MNLQITTPKLPAFTQRVIYWHKSEDSGWAFILVGYCPDTLAYFIAFYQDALKTFPDLKPEDVTCGKVKNSRYNQGFTLCAFRIPGPKRKIKGWQSRESAIDFDY